MTVTLDGSIGLHLHTPRHSHAAEVVTREVDEHDVLGVLLGVRAKLLLPRRIYREIIGPWGRLQSFLAVEELKPGQAAAGREELEADLRRRLMLIYHPVGTARMSDTDEQAVVDSQLRVHGLEALRVIDASVMPTIVGGNTNAPTIMIAEKAADLIRGRVADSVGEQAA